MFARVTSLKVRSEFIDRGIQIFRDSVIPAARGQKGYRGAILLSDSSTGKALSISLWDREQHARMNERNRYYHEQLLKFLALFASDPVREGFSVEVFDLK